MMLLATSISVYATSCLYNSSDVSYTAPTGSGLSANVQDSLTEVYGHCTDYTSMDTRVSSLEGHFLNNTTSIFNGNMLNINSSNSNNRGIEIRDASNKERSYLFYSPSDDRTYLTSNNSLGNIGTGTLSLRGNPVTINGVDISNTSSVNIKSNVNSTNAGYSGSGDLYYVKYGRIVLVSIWLFFPKVSGSRAVIATGLPKAAETSTTHINGQNGVSYPVGINKGETQICWWWASSTNTQPASGQLIYISES